jgi:hypothetical protein
MIRSNIDVEFMPSDAEDHSPSPAYYYLFAGILSHIDLLGCSGEQEHSADADL